MLNRDSKFLTCRRKTESCFSSEFVFDYFSPPSSDGANLLFFLPQVRPVFQCNDVKCGGGVVIEVHLHVIYLIPDTAEEKWIHFALSCRAVASPKSMRFVQLPPKWRNTSLLGGDGDLVFNLAG